MKVSELSLPMNATNLEELRCKCDVLITDEAHNLEEHRDSCVKKISQERCTGSARSGGEAHLFSRTDRSLKRKVALIWLGHKLETEKRVRVGGYQKDP